MDSKHIVSIVTLGLLIVAWAVVILVSKLLKTLKRRERSNQTADIWNISGRVNHQEGPVTSEPHRWPTHDHHVSIDSFVVPENLQPQKMDRFPPPPYSEVDLPTYEQATGLPKPKDELASVHVASSSTNCAGSRS